MLKKPNTCSLCGKGFKSSTKLTTSVTAMKDLTNAPTVIQDSKNSIANKSILLYTVMKSHSSAAYVKRFVRIHNSSKPTKGYIAMKGRLVVACAKNPLSQNLN